MNSSLVLTFHGLKTTSIDYKSEKGLSIDRYIITANIFKDILSRISADNCTTVSGLLNNSKANNTILTFDDGLISDYEVAFPLLEANNLKATFYITANNVGKHGYMTAGQIMELVKAGNEIGSHGLTHDYLVTMDRKKATEQIIESKDSLENLIGKKIKSYSPVGGHYRKWMIKIAKAAWYNSFATMIPGLTFFNDEFVIVKRNHIQAEHDTKYISGLLDRKTTIIVLNQVNYYFRYIPKRIIGMHMYDKLKNIILKCA